MEGFTPATHTETCVMLVGHLLRLQNEEGYHIGSGTRMFLEVELASLGLKPTTLRVAADFLERHSTPSRTALPCLQ
jgi:hypothetical protein